jgi:hypothetical protein
LTAVLTVCRGARTVTWSVALLTLGCRGDSQGRGSALDSVPGAAAAVGDQGPMSVLDSTITSLRFSLESIDEAFESLPDELRADSGSARADTAVLRLQAALDEMVVDVVKTFNDAEFQALMWPEGVRGQRLQARKRAGQEVAPADPRIADSLRVFLDAHGIWSYRAEGDTYFVLSLARFLQATSPYITEGAREALRIALLEQLSPQGPGAVARMQWDSLGDRLAITDRFLATFPAAAASKDIRDRRDRYRYWFLTGADHQDVFASSTGVLDPAARASFERYVQRHGSTESAALVRTYLELLATSQYRRTPEVAEFLRTQVELEHR